jgi:5-methylcytosine-specific restriction endonuclease McrA
MPKVHDWDSPEADEYRRLYKTAEWQRLREEVIRRDMGTCRMCGILCKTGERSPRTATVDHVTPHKGGLELFFDPANLQLLCAACHDGSKKFSESRGYSREVGLDGYPTDPRHPINLAQSALDRTNKKDIKL